MKKTRRIMGVGLVLVLLVSLLLMAVPVSASTLGWSVSTAIPDDTDKVVQNGTSLEDMVVSADGQTIYVVSGTVLYKSTDGGDSFGTVTLPTGLTTAHLIAMAPDDSDIVVLAGDANNLNSYISINGGSAWSSLQTIEDEQSNAAFAILDIAISAMSGSVRYVAAAGQEAANDNPALYYFDYGATVGDWSDACDNFNYPLASDNIDSFNAVAFSPNFASDQVMVAVSSENGTATANGYARFHIASFNQEKWDAAVFTSYPVELESTANVTTSVNAADISLDPEYLAGDDTTRIAFVGLSMTSGTSEIGGVYRLKDTEVEQDKTGVGINSVAWDGVNIAAGAYASNDVYRSADALASSPTYSTSRSYKEIGVDQPGGFNDRVIVRWGDSGTLLGVKLGESSAFSRSTDNGKTWNDIALIDTTLDSMEDIWVSPDGSVVYLLTVDTTDNVSMLWCKESSSWTRIFSDNTTPGYIVRAAASNPDVVYIADDGSGATAMFYSTDGGRVKWTPRASRYTIADLAVQDADVAYVANVLNDEVSKTTNGGFTWDPDVDSKSAGGTCATLTLLADDELLLGTTDGYVSYSSDGNGSWTKIADALGVSGATQVTASGLNDGDYIYAATSGNTTLVERWQIGQSGTDWKNLAAPVSDNYGCYGLVLHEGALYAMTSDNVNNNSALLRTLNPTSSTPSASMWVTSAAAGQDFSLAPSALRISTGSAVIWACNTVATGMWSFTDTLSTGLNIQLVSPVEGYQNPVNPVSGNSQDISFKWTKPESGTTALTYEVRIKAADGATTLATVTRNSTDSAAPNLLIGPTQTAATASQSVGLLSFAPGQTYYWQVRATSPVDSPWSGLRSFTIETLQAAVPEILSPLAGSTTSDLMPSFSWSPVSGASKYQFKLADNVGLTTPIVDVTLATTGYALDKSLTVGKTYYWAVKSVEPVSGTWSSIANFKVVAEATAAPTTAPVTITQVPAPNITVTAPAAPPATTITIPPVEQPAPITPAFIWAIIIIGAILVIAVVVLIVRTRRTV